MPLLPVDTGVPEKDELPLRGSFEVPFPERAPLADELIPTDCAIVGEIDPSKGATSGVGVGLLMLALPEDALFLPELLIDAFPLADAFPDTVGDKDPTKGATSGVGVGLLMLALPEDALLLPELLADALPLVDASPLADAFPDTVGDEEPAKGATKGVGVGLLMLALPEDALLLPELLVDAFPLADALPDTAGASEPTKGATKGVGVGLFIPDLPEDELLIPEPDLPELDFEPPDAFPLTVDWPADGVPSGVVESKSTLEEPPDPAFPDDLPDFPVEALRDSVRNVSSSPVEGPTKGVPDPIALPLLLLPLFPDLPLLFPDFPDLLLLFPDLPDFPLGDGVGASVSSVSAVPMGGTKSSRISSKSLEMLSIPSSSGKSLEMLSRSSPGTKPSSPTTGNVTGIDMDMEPTSRERAQNEWSCGRHVSFRRGNTTAVSLTSCFDSSAKERNEPETDVPRMN